MRSRYWPTTRPSAAGKSVIPRPARASLTASSQFDEAVRPPNAEHVAASFLFWGLADPAKAADGVIGALRMLVESIVRGKSPFFHSFDDPMQVIREPK
jgi:hypothetical protein